MSEYERFAACKGCGGTWSGFAACHCPTCHLNFVSVNAFDDHRIGDYEPNSRRCLTVVELKALGAWQDDRDYWHSPTTVPSLL